MARPVAPSGAGTRGVTYQATRDIPIGDLTRFPGNARRGDTEQIRASLRRHGQYRSLVVRDTGTRLVILAGNHTRDALEAEGHQTARCEVITCTDDEALRINITDNRMNDLAGDDQEALALLLSGLDGDFDGTGWSEDDFAALLGDDEPQGRGDPDAAPEPPAEPVTVPGDLYQLGPHRLLCGDCRTDIGRLAPWDIVLTDPPYGVAERTDRGKKGRGGGGGLGGFIPSKDFEPVYGDDEPFDPSHLLGNKRLVLFGANYFAERLPVSPSWIVWDKLDGLTTDKRDIGFDDNADCEMAWTNLGGPARIVRHQWKGVMKASERGSRRACIRPRSRLPSGLRSWSGAPHAASASSTRTPAPGHCSSPPNRQSASPCCQRSRPPTATSSAAATRTTPAPSPSASARTEPLSPSASPATEMQAKTRLPAELPRAQSCEPPGERAKSSRLTVSRVPKPHARVIKGCS